LSVAFGRLATTDDEVDLSVGRLECTIGVAPFEWWRWSLFFPIVVMAVVVVLATSIIASILSSVVTLVVTAITPVVITPIILVIATVVITFVIAAIGSAIMVITSIRSTVPVVKALATVSVVVVVALGLLGVGRYSKGTLQLFAFPHGMFGITMELTLVAHDHVEVTFEEGGRSWWIHHVGFSRSLL
jgi:hypothetical protein